MKIHIKNTATCATALLKASVPPEVITEILGKTYPHDAKSMTYIVEAPLGGHLGHWDIPAECVELVRDLHEILES